MQCYIGSIVIKIIRSTVIKINSDYCDFRQLWKMVKRKNFFDALSEGFKSKCLKSDSETLYLFGNTIAEARVLHSDVQDEILQETAEDEIPDQVEIQTDIVSQKTAENLSEEDKAEKELEEYLTKDPVAKQQFEYDRSTCFVNDVPEIGVNESLSLAPAQGKVPKNILFHPNWDRETFSLLDSVWDGEENLNADRLTPLNYKDFFSQRMLSFNKDFNKSAAYLFAAVQYAEAKQLQGNLNIAFQKGKKTVSEVGTSYKLEDPWTVLDGIKGTPRYFRTKKYEFLAKLENLGGFHIFFTLSCGDKRWSENFTSILELEGHIIGYNNDFDEVTVDGNPLMDFLNQNEGQHEFIRKNILNATRDFDNRLKMFIKHIIMNKFSSLPVKFYNYRIEFQLRGAGHCHGVLWVNIMEFCKQNPGFEGLEVALSNISDDKILSELEEDQVTRFANKISTVSLKDPVTVDIVKKVNFHHCTRACRKYSDFCRFHFPKFPVSETLVATPCEISYPDPEERKLVTLKIKLVLSKVKKVLKDDDLMTVIVRDTETQDIKTRIIAMLRRAEICEDLGVTNDDELYDKYVECLKVSFRGYQIILKRDIDEIFINNYNSEWIMAWDANLDIQLCLDHYAIVTYVMEYLNKDESGTYEFIIRALKDSESSTLQERLKLVKNTFQTHRQIGQSEAIYRLFSSFHLSGSNIGTQFIHTGFRYNKSKMLRQISEEEAKSKGKNAIILAEHPDKYFEETTSLENRYDDRPRSLQHITLSQFAKRYTLSSKNMSNKTEENLSDDNENLSDEIDLKESNEDVDDIYKPIIISSYPELRTNLPKLIHIGSRSMQLRSPICLRYHKFKMSSEPHEYYFSQLRLFYPHSREDMNIWEKDLDKCREAFNKNEEAIKYVRSKVMKYQEQVEVHQEKAQADYDASIGDILDSAKEQDMSDCKEEGLQDPDNFVALDPSLAPVDKSDLCEVKASKYVKIELSNLDDLLNRTRTMDPDQRRIVNIGVEFAGNVRKSRYNDVKRPSPPYIVAQGGAGSGKSFVINTMTEWMERIFRQPGDNPNYPYILKLAFTGTAANIINGQTINSSLKLPFGNILPSLDNKTAARVREELINLQALIVDEYSMVRPDMLYQIDVRLQEIKQKTGVPFGGVAVFLFGDILQLRPTTGKKFIFQSPSNDKYKTSFNVESMFGELFVNCHSKSSNR